MAVLRHERPQQARLPPANSSCTQAGPGETPRGEKGTPQPLPSPASPWGRRPDLFPPAITTPRLLQPNHHLLHFSISSSAGSPASLSTLAAPWLGSVLYRTATCHPAQEPLWKILLPMSFSRLELKCRWVTVFACNYTAVKSNSGAHPFLSAWQG